MIDNKKIVYNSLTYFLFSIISQILNFILIPIYTKNITTDEFGQYNIVTSLQSFLSIFITLGIFSGLMRFMGDTDDKQSLKNTALNFSVMWGAAICIIIKIIAPILAPVLFKEDPLGYKYIEYIAQNASLLCIISIYTSFLSMEFKALKASIIETAKMILLIFLTYYYLNLKIKKGGIPSIIGIFHSQLICYGIVVVFLILIDIKNIRLKIKLKQLKLMLSFGLGIIPGQVSSWVLTLVDRYFIKNMINLSAVGIYSMGYKIGMIIEPLFLAPFQSTFTPFKFSVYKEQDGKEKIIEFFNIYNFLGWFVILGLSLYAEIAIKILSTSDYSSAYIIVPTIAFSYYLWGMGSFYNLGLIIANKMLLSSMIVSSAAVINIILDALFIPYLGIYGAALATALSYIAANTLYFYFGKNYYDLGIDLLKPYRYGVVFLSIYIIYLFNRLIIKSIVLQFFSSLILCILYIAICIAFKLISYQRVLDMVIKFMEEKKYMKLSSILTLIKNKDFKEISKRIKNKFLTRIYSYRLNLNNFSCKNTSYEYRAVYLNHRLLKRMASEYKDELDNEKVKILKEAIGNIFYKPYVILDRENQIYGYYHIAYRDIFDSLSNTTIEVKKNYIYLYDGYTFKKHRRKGAIEFALKSALINAQKKGYHYAIVNVLDGNYASENAIYKYGFKKYMKYDCYHIGFIKKTFKTFIYDDYEYQYEY